MALFRNLQVGKLINIIVCSGIKTLHSEDDTYAIVLSPIPQENILTTYAVFRTEVCFSILPVNSVPLPELTIKMWTLIFPTILLTVQRDGIQIAIPYLLGRLQLKTHLWQRISSSKEPHLCHKHLNCTSCTDRLQFQEQTCPERPSHKTLGGHSLWLRSLISQLLQEGNDTIRCKYSHPGCKFIFAPIFLLQCFSSKAFNLN